MKKKSRSIDGRLSRGEQSGFSLLETMFAAMILLIGVTGLMTLFVVAAVRNANNGDQATRATEYAQDKIEQLLALPYGDATSEVAGFPTTVNGCLAGCGLSVNGSLTTLNAHYSDFIDTTGAPVTAVIAPNAKAYTRYWLVDTPAGLPAGMKRITVKVVANLTIGTGSIGTSSLSPVTTLVSFKSNATYF